MNKMVLIIGLAMVATVVMSADEASAQHRSRGLLQGNTPVYSGTDMDGMTLNQYPGRVRLPRTLKMASHNHFSPQRVYTYSNPGLEAGRTHTWNQEEAAGRPWHGDYKNWRWGEPTALVVPPTASYQTSYAWGVGQVRSTPIHHQFGRNGAGMIGGGGGGAFSPTPYLPSSTEQFGLYPVRAPW